jgi:hypothetical protein
VSVQPPAWEASYARFANGESLEKIALTQESGKPIQPSTVTSHLMTALTQGRPMPLERLAQQAVAHGCAPPTESEWEQLTSAEAATAMDVVKTEKVLMTDLLKSFLPAAEKEFAARSEAEKAVLNVWYGKINWFMALRRIGMPLSFAGGGGGKRARLG